MATKTPRRRFTTAFKRKVLDEATRRGNLSAVARKHELNPTLVAKWRTTLSDSAPRAARRVARRAPAGASNSLERVLADLRSFRDDVAKLEGLRKAVSELL